MYNLAQRYCGTIHYRIAPQDNSPAESNSRRIFHPVFYTHNLFKPVNQIN